MKVKKKSLVLKKQRYLYKMVIKRIIWKHTLKKSVLDFLIPLVNIDVIKMNPLGLLCAFYLVGKTK